MKKLRLPLLGAVVVALVATSAAAAFTPTNTYYGKQWYLNRDNAFDAWPAPPTDLAPVRVAIIDSGVDCSLPDFTNQIAKSKSFVGGSACIDNQGHGTIVAGEIAGALNQAGVIGLAFSSQLLVAKVVAADGTIPLKAEAAGIRWAVRQGAKVVNLSFGAVRDPGASLDSYSKVEARAVAFAVKRGAVVVAAAGNADEAPVTPWPYASWPAALPHVIGVGALTRSGNVPDFSDEDPVFVDMAAPGTGIFSTFPKDLTSEQPKCSAQGYTDCASGDYKNPVGTSFAAPQVSAAAAVLFGVDPSLTSSQVTRILERHTDDVNAASGCDQCPDGRDKYSGWGSLDVNKAVDFVNSGNSLPPTDRYEPNDKTSEAHRLWGRRPDIAATLDYWDDPVDVYRVRLVRGQHLHVRAAARWSNAAVRLTLLRHEPKVRVARTARAGRTQQLSYRAPHTGWYDVSLLAVRHSGGRYTLQLSKS